MPEEKEPQTEKMPITPWDISLGIVGAVLILGTGGILIMIFINFLGLFGDKSGNVGEALKASNKELAEYEAKLDAITMQCQGTCATVTGQNLVKWPLTIPAPVVVTCNGNRQFLKASNQWYERNTKPESDYPSWTAIQKTNGIWPFQTRPSLDFLGEVITKACQGG